MNIDDLITQALPHTVDEVSFPGAKAHFKGKVRESFSLGNDQRLIVVTDRVSAFDFILGTIPFKGQVLNQVANHWFSLLDEIGVHHHLIESTDPNVSRVREGQVIPIEMVVRGYLTGSTTTSSWYAYQYLDRKICGITLPEGLKKNQAFASPIITPTTKADSGHDLAISRQEILSQGIVSADLWQQIEDLALKMFTFGQKKALERGLILVDTKYEMALDKDGRLMVIDEVHTPDSSRYWIADTYQARFEAGENPDMLDKEFVRTMTVANGYDVDSSEDPRNFFDTTIQQEAAKRYIELYERITGKAFAFPKDLNVKKRIEAYLQNLQYPL
ncbi:MAG TPA: phosphoribosylaminoimidazolesuccinocarboxamide synthase [Candidatus Gracilibacteria bacterium]